MKPEFERYERIENYLRGKLSPQEKVDFENLINSDLTVAGEVKEHKVIHELIIDQGLLDIKQKLNALDAKHRKGGSNRLLYTITFLMVVITATLIYKNLQKNSNEERVVSKPLESPLSNSKDERDMQEKDVRNSVTSENKKTIIKKYVPATDTVEENLVVSTDTLHLKLQSISAHTAEISEVDGGIANETIETKAVIPCLLSDSFLEITTEASCGENPSGKILIGPKSALKGKEPFSFSVNGIDFYRSSSFYNLAPGRYFVWVKDSLGCIWMDTSELTVSEKDCRSHEYAFNPKYGEKWIIPLDNETKGKLEIYNRSGSLVYATEIVNGFPDSWDGTGSGGALPLGNYSFVLSTKSKRTIGHVTIVR